MRVKLPHVLEIELQQSIPGRWRVRERRRHLGLEIDGNLVTVFSKGKSSEDWPDRTIMNARASIRRYIRNVLS